MSAETAREVKPHVAVDTDLGLLGVSLLVELLVLQAAVAQLTVVTPVRLQPLEPSLRLAPSGRGLLLLGVTATPLGGGEFWTGGLGTTDSLGPGSGTSANNVKSSGSGDSSESGDSSGSGETEK